MLDRSYLFYMNSCYPHNLLSASSDATIVSITIMYKLNDVLYDCTMLDYENKKEATFNTRMPFEIEKIRNVT